MPGFSSFPRANFESFTKRLREALPNLPSQEAKLAQFINLNLSSLALETGKSLAEKAGVTEVTVGRLMRRLGVDGMRGLKLLLRDHYSVAAAPDPVKEDIPQDQEDTHAAEIKAISGVFSQAQGENWDKLVALLGQSTTVYVTGFQSVKGISEDFTRRLSLARRRVRFLSAHDGMLGEWLDLESGSQGASLVLVDVVPYARESQKLARLAKDQGFGLIIISDEFCHWSAKLADATIYAPSRTGLFLESTIGIVMALNLIVDATANLDPDASSRRLVDWKTNAKRLGLF